MPWNMSNNQNPNLWGVGLDGALLCQFDQVVWEQLDRSRNLEYHYIDQFMIKLFELQYVDQGYDRVCLDITCTLFKELVSVTLFQERSFQNPLRK